MPMLLPLSTIYFFQLDTIPTDDSMWNTNAKETNQQSYMHNNIAAITTKPKNKRSPNNVSGEMSILAIMNLCCIKLSIQQYNWSGLQAA